MWVLHFAPLKQCALIIIMWVLHFAPLKQCALIIIMWVLLHGVFRHGGFKIQSRFCISEHFQ
jgi:di/tricarboxylate transporter